VGTEAAVGIAVLVNRIPNRPKAQQGNREWSILWCIQDSAELVVVQSPASIAFGNCRADVVDASMR